ncbi:MAG: co-chaperone DjlA [Desulfobacteraceae bacterium]|jgi:DnaJ like chaperone protein
MGWFGKLTLGSLGFLMGGPLGAIAGGALGHILFDKEGNIAQKALPFGHAEQAQAAYFISLFSILGKLAKADGVISREEINIVNQFLSTLRLPEQQKQFAKSIFNEAKDSPYSIDDFAAQLYQVNRNQPTILLSFMDLLFKVAAADGTLHDAEQAALFRIKNIFRISDSQFDDLKSVYFKQDDRYYRTLNCTMQSTIDEIKSSYKKLVKEYHPDMIISKGLPEEFVDVATKKFQEIQEAYSKVRKERGF